MDGPDQPGHDEQGFGQDGSALDTDAKPVRHFVIL
jgi:hypothetical protein